MSIPSDLKYTNSHEWIREVDGHLVIGITDFAQHQLGDLTFVELPDVDAEFAAADEVSVVESVKAASEIYAPVAGKVVAVNDSLEMKPELINSDPYGEGWIYKLEPTGSLDALLDAAAYAELAPESN